MPAIALGPIGRAALRTYRPKTTLVLALSGLLIALIGYLTTHIDTFTVFAYTADGLYFADLYDDVRSGTGISGWKYSGANYLFPDVLLYFVIRAFTNTPPVVLLVSGVIHFIAFAGGLAWLACRLCPAYSRWLSITVMALMATIYLALADRLASVGLSFFFMCHFGILALLPVGLALAHYSISRSTPSVGLLGVLFFLSTLLGASDSLHIVQFIAPLVATLLALAFCQRVAFNRMVVVNGLLLASGLIGWVVGRIIVGRYDTVPYFIAFSRAPASVHNFIIAVEALASAYPLHAGLIAGFIGLCVTNVVAETVSRLRTRRQSTVTTGQLFFSFYYLFLLAGNTAIIVGAGAFLEAASTRYFHPVLLLPAFVGWPFIITPLVPFKPALINLLTLGISLPVALTSIPRIDVPKATAQIEAEYYPALVRCLDSEAPRRGIKYGVAEYWRARPLTRLSKQHLQVVPVTQNLAPFHWCNNVIDFNIEPEFIVVDRTLPVGDSRHLDERLIAANFGQPAATFDCVGQRVLVYNRPEDRVFRQWLKQSALMHHLEKPGDAAEFHAAFLPSQTGAVAGFARVADNAPAGFLSYGPFVTLPPGDYTFAIHYTAANAGAPVGRWDVRAADSKLPNAELSSTGELDERARMVTGVFQLSESQLIEIRVFYAGQGYLAVEKIRVERLK